MRTITIWKEEKIFGSEFKDGDKIIGWEDLTEQERKDFVSGLYQFADFFNRFIQQKSNKT